MSVPRIVRALIERDASGRLAYRLSFFFEAATGLFFFIAVYYVGRLISSDATLARELLRGHDYFTTTMIGIGLYAFMSSVYAAPRTFFLSELGYGTLETLLTLGPRLSSYVAAFSLYAGARACLRTILIVALAWLVGADVSLAAWHQLPVILLLGGAAAFGLGLVQLAVEIRVRRVSRLAAFVQSLSALLTGVYFPVALLPGPFQHLSSIMPTTRAISAARQALLENTIPWAEYAVLAILAGILVTLGAALLRSSHRAMLEEGSYVWL